MPRWSPWLESVQVSPDDATVSRWKLSSRGFQVSWLAKNVEVTKNQVIRWESIDGLPNKGSIRFTDRSRKGRSNVVVRMSVEYDIPGWIGELADNLVVGRLVEATLKSDLERFREIIMKEKKFDHEQSAVSSSTSQLSTES